MRNFLILTLCLLAMGCGADRSLDATPDTIRVAVLPDQVPGNLRARHEPLLAYLRDTTGIRFELVIPENYSDLLRQFEAGAVDLAWFGGLTFVTAEQNANAVPIALRDVDVQFTSCYLVSASSKRSSIAAFEDESFSFGPELSTSGHLMPRYFLQMQGVVPEEFFSSVRHAPGHDQAAAWVADGTVTIGVANCVIVQSLLANGQLSHDEVRILETTPPYSDYVWAAQESMDERTRGVVLEAFLALDATVSEHAEILRLQGANLYLPAGGEDFALVRAAAEEAGLLNGEIAR